MTANLDFHAGWNGAYLNYLTDAGDVLLLQEAKDLNVASLLPAGWVSTQDRSSEAKAGSCLAVRTDRATVGRSWLVKGCDAPAGGGMLPRWIACAELTATDSGEKLTGLSAHAPPPRYSELQPTFNASLSKVVKSNPNPIVGADANQNIDAFARALGAGMVAYGKTSGICLVTADELDDLDVDAYPEGEGWSDHPCVWGSLG